MQLVAPAAASRSPARPTAGRDQFLDAIRTIAIVRVVVWHMYGAAVISYFVAAMPAMFFVSGSLLATSLARRPWPAVLRDRFRRILVPLWAFAAVAWVVMTVAAGSGGPALPWGRFAAWVVPVVDPRGIGEIGDWLASPLWFLRMLVWLLVLSPALAWALRRFGGGILALGPVLVLVCHWCAQRAALQPAAVPELWWYAGELALYGSFFTAGMLHARTGFRATSAGRWVAVAATAAGAALLWALTQPVPGGVVNDSQPLHLAVGVTWLALAFAARPFIVRVAARARVACAIRLVSRRSFTIYLWHTTVIFVVLEFLQRRGSSSSWVNDVSYAVLVAFGIAVAVAAFGWAEDVAARRRITVLPTPVRSARLLAARVVMATCVAGAAAVAVEPWVRLDGDAAAGAGVFRPRVPSQQPPPPTFVPEGASGPAAPPVVALAELPAALRHRVAQWRVAHDVPGLAVMVRDGRTGREWATAVGHRVDGTRIATGDRIDSMSVTKLFTAALVMRAVDGGTIALDDPLPELDVVPELAAVEGLTVRHLLEHRSGLVDYRQTPEWDEDPTTIDSAAGAVAAVARQPLLFVPGSGSSYSSVNFLVLGILLEQVTGRDYDELLGTEILEPLALHGTRHRASEPAAPRHGAAGIETTLADLVAAAEAIVRPSLLLSPTAHAAMHDVDPFSGIGPGLIGFCPCTTRGGVPSFFAHGYTGSSTLVAHVPTLDVAIALDVGDDLWTDARRMPAVLDLMAELVRTAAASWRAAPIPPTTS